eukprot:7215952-Heterocapsa_arctica.AAC.1
MAHVLNIPCHECRPSQRQDRARLREADPFRPRPDRAHNREAEREDVQEILAFREIHRLGEGGEQGDRHAPAR